MTPEQAIKLTTTDNPDDKIMQDVNKQIKQAIARHINCAELLEKEELFGKTAYSYGEIIQKLNQMGFRCSYRSNSHLLNYPHGSWMISGWDI